jgi:hypothetical protein
MFPFNFISNYFCFHFDPKPVQSQNGSQQLEKIMVIVFILPSLSLLLVSEMLGLGYMSGGGKAML